MLKLHGGSDFGLFFFFNEQKSETVGRYEVGAE